MTAQSCYRVKVSVIAPKILYSVNGLQQPSGVLGKSTKEDFFFRVFIFNCK